MPSFIDIDISHIGLARVSRGKIQFYYYPYYPRDLLEDAKWTLIPEMDFALPKDYKTISIDLVDGEEVFIIGVTNNSIKHFLFNGKWEEAPEYNIALPKKSEQFFLLKYNWGIDWYFGIIEGGKIIFFEYKSGNWEEIPEMAFSLPDGYKDISTLSFETDRTIAILTANNNVRFFQFKDEWEENHARSLVLPNNAKSIFGFDASSIGVVYDNYIQYYDYSTFSNRWENADDIAKFEFSP